MREYRTILIDPPWRQGMVNTYRKPQNKRPARLPYASMTLDQLAALPVGGLAAEGAHLWLWTTNQYLAAGFALMAGWGFTYLAPITWVKPSGIGNYFVHRTQTLLFGYKQRCLFPLARYRPTVLFAPTPTRHSTKPEESYQLVESISPGPRLELFARASRAGWDAWGDEAPEPINLIA
jgi:N6-adenosine-specific RNA methylase IME4